MLARGVTAAGITYTARLARPQPFPAALARADHIKLPPPRHCMDVAISVHPAAVGGFTLGCPLPPVRRLSRTSVDCRSGLLTITAQAPSPDVRARLTLSDGRTIVSPLIALPRSKGASSRLYFQILRGPSPIPVSLSALGAAGRTLDTVRLARVVDCSKHPFHSLVHVDVASTPLPGGGTLEVRGERHSFLGHAHTCFHFTVDDQEAQFCPQSPLSPPVVLTTQVCGPHARDYAYALLPNSRARLVLLHAGRRIAVHQVAVPAPLRLPGSLAYAIAPPGPLAGRLVAAPGARPKPVEVAAPPSGCAGGPAGSTVSVVLVPRRK